MTSYDKIKIKTKGFRKYYILDNGAEPFLMYVRKNQVYIYSNPHEEYDAKNKASLYTKLVKSYKPIKVWIGKSLVNEMTLFSGGHGKRFNGNSNLLQLSKQKYVYVGIEIIEFTIDDQIVHYYSSVGNSWVPYPCAYGKKYAYVFTLADGVLIYSYEKNPEIKQHIKNNPPSDPDWFWSHPDWEIRQKLPPLIKTSPKSHKVVHKRPGW